MVYFNHTLIRFIRISSLLFLFAQDRTRRAHLQVNTTGTEYKVEGGQNRVIGKETTNIFNAILCGQVSCNLRAFDIANGYG